MQQLARADKDDALVQAYDEQGRIWHLLAAVQLRNKVIALQVRAIEPGPDSLTKIDEAMMQRLSLDLDELNEAHKLLQLERDHWVKLLRQAEARIAAVRKILEGT